MERTRLKLDIAALGLFFAVVFLSLSLASYDPEDAPNRNVWPGNAEAENICGVVGSVFAYGMIASLGWAAVVPIIALVVVDVCLFSRREISDRYLRVIGVVLLTLTSCALLDLLLPGHYAGSVAGSGGYLGVFTSLVLSSYFSKGGTYLILVTALLTGLMLTCDYVLVRIAKILLGAMGGRARSWVRAIRPAKQADSEDPEPDPRRKIAFGEKEEVPEPEQEDEQIPFNTPETEQVDDTTLAESLNLATEADAEAEYQLPSLDLLLDPASFPYALHAESIREKGNVLERTLLHFGYNVKVVQIDTGPVITQYEIELEAGLRVGKVHSLADDLAIGLKAPAVRIVAPIPGRDTVGIEVPNDQRSVVRLKEVIRGSAEKTAKMKIPLFLGKDVKGNPLVYDLADMPHLLIAGRTGTGKSVCLNALIQSILMTRRPNEVKMLMIDPKMVELSQYRRIPHLMHPVVTDMKKAEALLAWAVDKMEERYDILARAGVRHASSYNQLTEEEIYNRLRPANEEDESRIPKHMPYIVIFADEMADLMMTAPKEVEGHIIRLAQKSRAVGIHLIIATQKPTVDVITGLIKSNLPARIAFQVSSRSDSRVVLDESGAEKLLGHGDMLFLVPGTSRLVRAQGTFTSDEEIDSVVGFLESYEPEYTRELLQLGSTAKKDGQASWSDRDEVYEQAIDVLVREGRGSVSLLQRALGIGYGRAARLIDYMAEDGIVGDYNGSQAREVLVTPEEWDEMRHR